MADKVNFIPAIIFYLIYNFGIVYFAVLPNLKEGASLSHALISGAILGAFAYATYDLTNHATLKNWPAIISIIDIVWGAFLTASCSAVCVYFFN